MKEPGMEGTSIYLQALLLWRFSPMKEINLKQP